MRITLQFCLQIFTFFFFLVTDDVLEQADSDSDHAEDAAQGGVLNVPWGNLLALGTDNANVMVGAENGVFGHMKRKCPQLHLAGCPCHLLHRAAEKACKAMPFNVDEVLVDTYYYFDKSSKRQEGLEQFQEEVKHQKILKHVSTRWLSVRRCIERLLENWDALKLFFHSQKETSATKTAASTTQARLDRLCEFFKSPTNRLYCLFLSHALQLFDTLNLQLQNEAPQVHVLHSLLHKFLRDCLMRFVKPSAMVGKLAVDVDYQQGCHQKVDGDLVIGESTEKFIQKKEEVHLRDKRLKEFYGNVRKFWTLACIYVKVKFPLDNKVLLHAKVANPLLRAEPGQLGSLKFLLTRFPCLLPAGITQDVIINEFTDYQSSSSVISAMEDTERVDHVWLKLEKVKDTVGQPQFQHLSRVMLSVLTIPHSNAACERIFSCIRKNKTDQRASLEKRTLESLMVVKSQPGEPHKRTYTNTQLRQLKSAYYQELSDRKKEKKEKQKK